jgi:hypothetical protein
MNAIALAGGGERAVAWETGVLAGLADAGLDPRSAATAHLAVAARRARGRAQISPARAA